MITVETLQQWEALSAQLKSVRKMELAARRTICSFILGGPKAIGTKHQVFGETEAHASVTTSLSIDDGELREMLPRLTAQEREAIKWVPKLKKREYDALPKDNQLKHIVKMSVNAPTLSINKLDLT